MRAEKKSHNALAHVQKVYSFWGRFPFLYQLQDIVTFLGRAGTLRRTAVERLGVHFGDTVLEVACGTGRNFRYIERSIGEKGRLMGFDYSAEMLQAAQQLCRRKGRKNVKLVQGDAAQLNIQERNFDGVVSVLGISAVPGWKKALCRCHAVLRQGGRLVVCDARLFSGRLSFFNPLVKIIYSRFAAWDPSKNIPAEMKDIFGNVDVEKFNFGTFFIAVSVKTR